MIIGHLIGTALGVGGATASDFLFLRSTKNNRIEKEEFDLLQTISSLVWLGLIILIISGIGFIVLKPEQLSNPKLWAKLVVVGVILINGIFIHKKIIPIFKSGVNKKFSTGPAAKHQTAILTSGAISIISWYSALVLGAWKQINNLVPFETILIGYVTILLFGIIIANISGRVFLKKM